MYNIKKFVVGALQANSYLIWNDKGEASLFDIGSEDLVEILDFMKKKNLNLINLFLTHGHIDHIGGTNSLMRIFPQLKVYIGGNEKRYLIESEYNLSYNIFREIFKIDNMDRITFLNDGDKVFDMEVIDTPGHTTGGVCYYNKENNILISGDTMFLGSMGRTDFIGGNSELLFKSLKKLCDILPPETIVYSGHGMETTIEREKNNLFGAYYDEY